MSSGMTMTGEDVITLGIRGQVVALAAVTSGLVETEHAGVAARE
jgi:hypothetical protein